MSPETLPDSLIDVAEVSRLTTLQKSALYDLIKRGELRRIKLGRKTVFSKREVSNWIAAKIAGAYANG